MRLRLDGKAIRDRWSGKVDTKDAKDLRAELVRAVEKDGGDPEKDMSRYVLEYRDHLGWNDFAGRNL